MIRRSDLARDGPRRLARVELVGVSDQIVSTTYEVHSPAVTLFVTLAEARRAYAQARRAAGRDG